jgi:hypothetical protein
MMISARPVLSLAATGARFFAFEPQRANERPPGHEELAKNPFDAINNGVAFLI